MHRKMLTTMLKQVLKLSQGRLDVAAVEFDTILVKTELKITDTMSEQTEAYSEAVKKACKGHKLGSPHVWAWGGLVCGLITHYSDKIVDKNLAALLEVKQIMEMQNPKHG